MGDIWSHDVSSVFFHPTPMNAVEKWHCACNASVLAHVYEHAVSPLEGAKLLSAPPFLQQKCTSNLWRFQLLPQSPVNTAANGQKWSNHVFSQGGSLDANYTLCSHLICSHFSLKPSGTLLGVWGLDEEKKENSLVASSRIAEHLVL